MTGNIKFDVYRVSANVVYAFEAEKTAIPRSSPSSLKAKRKRGKVCGEFGTLKRFPCELRSAKTKFKGHLLVATTKGLREKDNRISQSFF